MRSAEVRPLSLSLLLEGASLVAVLSDARAMAHMGRVVLSAALLEEMDAAAELLRSLLAPPGAGEAARDVLGRRIRAREIGAMVFLRCFPNPIRGFLRDSAPRALDLQLSQALMPIPWEAAFDGHEFLGNKFVVSRHAVAEDGAPAPPAPPTPRVGRQGLRVLIVQGEPATADTLSPAQVMLRRLAGIEGLSVGVAEAAELGRREMLHVIEGSDVVHYLGPPPMAGPSEFFWWRAGDGMRIKDLGGLPQAPLLLVCHADSRAASADGDAAGMGAARHHWLAAAAALHGLNVLVRMTPPALQGDPPDFVNGFYRALAAGRTLGRAIREAAALATGAEEGLSCPDHVLYADAAMVLAPAPSAQGGLEDDSHRQVTIMSYDLVGSTQLLEMLGAEKYSDVLEQYHARCARIVARWGGRASNPQGSDGIMCYFGLPVAYEDSAVQCLRSAEELVQAVAELGLRVRVGVVTGPVVVKAGLPVGVSIHLAARLQAIAEPGSVVFSETTWRLVRQRFDSHRLSTVPPLKGFERPGALYRLLGEKRLGLSPFSDAPRSTPFIGREAELAQLRAYWDAAHAGALGAVRIWGGAGIGKSRLVREFRHHVLLPPCQALECHCTPEHASSAFYPLIDLLLRLFKIEDTDAAPARLAKIETGLGGVDAQGDAVAVLVALLSVAIGAEVPAPMYSAEKQRQRTLEVMAGLIAQQARVAPLCVIVEDVHWIDPSSLEFIGYLAQAAVGLPLMVLLTQREETGFPRELGLALHEIELKGISPDAARTLILASSGESAVSNEVICLLTEKADGVPLFIEESARMVADLQAAGGGDFSSLSIAVPGTIQDLLMARLDRLAGAKPLAQLGSVIGREFSFALIQAILAHASAPIRTGQLLTRLNALVSSGLVIEKRSLAGTSYFFKHALVRDAAYQSLWERDRRRFHMSIALVLTERFAEWVANRPEMAAQHYAGAALHARAIEHWERAARRAIMRSAHDEAISHLGEGLALVQHLPVDPARDRAELRLQLLLAGQLIATQGYGAERVGQVYQRAAELCRASGDDNSLLKVQLGLEGYHFMRADFEQAHAMAAQVEQLVSLSPDAMRRLQSVWALGNILFHQGELQAAVSHMDACLASYNALPRRPAAVQDPGVMCLCYSAVAKWELGHPDEALARAQAAVALAAELQHKFSAGEAYGFLAMVQYFRGEFEDVLRSAAKAIEICEEGGFAVWLAHARLFHGRARAALGEPAEGVAEMATGYAQWVATGAMVTRGFYLVMRAEGLVLDGRPQEALVLLRAAFDIVTRYGERYYEPEIRRLMGELTLLQSDRPHDDAMGEAQEWFFSALMLAKEKDMASLSLRAAISLARLWMEQGRGSEGRALLRSCRDAIEAGEATRDLQLAAALLHNATPERPRELMPSSTF